MHVDLKELASIGRRSAGLFATALVLASMNGTAVAATPSGATLAQPPIPNLLLLLDTSGSMENWTNGDANPPMPASCPNGIDHGDDTQLTGGTCFTAGYTSTSGQAISAPNKWGAVVQALSGSPIQSPNDLAPLGAGPYFRWYEMKRSVGSDFDNEYRLNGQPAEDVGYTLDYHRIATWDAANSKWCLLSPGYLPAGPNMAGLGVGTPSAGVSGDQPDSYSPGMLVGLTPGFIHTKTGMVSLANTGALQNCNYTLNNDGNIDAVRDLVRFGVMTFDNDIQPQTGVTATALGLQSSANGAMSTSTGLWSYFPGWNGAAAPAPGWINPNSTSPPLVGCTATPYNVIAPFFSTGSANPLCMPLGAYEVGARNPAAPAWEGRMVPFPDGRAGLSEQEGNNDEVKRIIEAVRPYGATPIAGMFTDARNYFRLDPNGPEASDPYVNSNYTGGHGCRPQYIILLTDGGANLDLRSTTTGCDSGTPNTCPFQKPEMIASDLCWGGPSVGSGTSCGGSSTYDAVTTYVIGFSIATFTSPDNPLIPVTCQKELQGLGTNVCTTGPSFCNTAPLPAPGSAIAACCNLVNIACMGSANQTPPFFADSASDLSGAFAAILKLVSRQASSHVVPVFATANAGIQFQSDYFTASYTTVPESAANGSGPWSGTITETEQACNTTTTTQTVYPTGSPAAPQVVGGSREFLVVANTAGTTTGDGATLRPFMATSLNDGITNVAAKEIWGPNIASLSTTADLQVNSFSCPADPVGGGRLSADGCAQYTRDFYTAAAGGTYPVTIPGPTGPNSNTYTAVDRSTLWLGPVVDSLPAYVSAPSLALSDTTYRAFADPANGYGARPNVLYVETTDGELHALNPDYQNTSTTYPGVQEFWTFLPPALNSQIVNNIPAADRTLLDASPIVADTVYNRSNSSGSGTGPADWHTTLVSSFAAGGRGFFALDVSQPYGTSFTGATPGSYPAGLQTNPHFLWQLTTGSGTVQPFGTHGATPAITTLFVAAFGQAAAETGVAILPGGSDGQAPTGTCIRTTSADQANVSAFKPRVYVRSWAAAPSGGALITSPCSTGSVPWAEPNGRTVTIVRLQDGAILAQFANDSGNLLGPIGSSVRIQTGFDSPMTGTPAVYPTGGGRIANSAYVSDADGLIWKLNLGGTNPATWSASMFFDSFNQGVTPSASLPSVPGLTPDQVAGALGQQLTAAPILSIGPNSELVMNFATGDQTLFTSKTFKPGSNDTPSDEIAVQNYVWSVVDTLAATPSQGQPHWFVPFTDGTTAEYNINPSTGSPTPHANFGERVTGPMALYDGVLYFATYWPDDAANGGGACQMGEARIYGMDYFTPRSSCTVASGVGCGGVQRYGDGSVQYFVPASVTQNLAGSLIPGVSITQVQPCLTKNTNPDTYFGNATPSFQQTNGVQQPQLTYVATANTTGSSLNATAATAPAGINIPQPQRNTKIDSWAQVIN